MTTPSSAHAGPSLDDSSVHRRVVAWLDNAGEPTVRFEPPMGLDWPLDVGKAWTARHTTTVHAGPRQGPLEVRHPVEALGDVTVPAGTFEAFRVVSTDAMGDVQTVWAAPSQGIATVRRVPDRRASHPAGDGRLESVLPK